MRLAWLVGMLLAFSQREVIDGQVQYVLGDHWRYDIEAYVRAAGRLVEEGSLYPALYRMERRGWIEAEWGLSELNRRAKLYAITEEGRAQLTVETERWQVFTAAVSKVLLAAEA